VNIKPGCITQVLIDISAIVMPFEYLAMDLLLKAWPKNPTKTVTNDNSIVFANKAVSRDAVEGLNAPPEYIDLPHRGCTEAVTSQSIDMDVE